MSEATEQHTPWLSEKEMKAWRAYIVGSALLEHRLNRELQITEGLSIADYEIMVALSEAPDMQMRMSELANEIAHSKSRMSHQIRRLESEDIVRRQECPNDGRGVLAVLTDKGLAKLRQAAPSHVRSVRDHMIDLLDPAEHEALASIFTRLTEHLRTVDARPDRL